MFYKKSCSYKFRNIYRKTPALELVLIKFIKETPAQAFSLWVLQNFKEHLFWRKSVNGCSWMIEIVYLKLKVGNLLQLRNAQQRRHKINSYFVSKDAISSFKKKFSLARTFPLAVMHTPSKRSTSLFFVVK